jgi:hypothetical protein
MNELHVEQAVAALVNHYVASSAGLISENITVSHGFKTFAFLFTSPGSRAEKVKRPYKNFRARKSKGKKGKVCSSEAFVVEPNADENLNPYFLFVQKQIAAVSQEFASEACGNSQVSISRKLNEMWAALTADAKEKYIHE